MMLHRLPLHVEHGVLVHVVVTIEQSMGIKRTLCLRVLRDMRPYHWTEAAPTCLECLAEDT